MQRPAARPGGLLDLSVYRAGSRRLLDGGSIYVQPYGELPFTYPRSLPSS